MTIKNIDAKTAQELIKNNQAVLVDVREVAENKAMRIKGSNLIPLGEICYDKLPKTDKKIIIHCKAGGRSLSACEKLNKQNPNLELYNLEGGITAWKDYGCDVIMSDESFITLERQVQITAGSSVFLGTLLGILVSDAFFIIPLFFGAGLIFAGITGWCGLGILLAKLPFNKGNNYCQTK